MEDMEKKMAFLLANSPHFMLKGSSSTYGKAAKDFIANGVVVREKGEWVDHTENIRGLLDDRFDCSVCGHIFWHSSARDFNFCPNCGADMRKDKTDE